MIMPLFKSTLKRNWSLILIFFLVLTMYSGVMISMYDPASMEAFDQMLALLPEGAINALGFSGIASDLAGYIAGTLYGMLLVAFPMVYSIILGVRLIAKPVDNGSMAYYLSTPNSRVKIVLTQGIYALLSVLVLCGLIFGLTVGICGLMFPGSLDIGQYFNVWFITLLVNLSAISICFFCSCLFNESKHASGAASAITIGMLLLSMIANASEDYKMLNNLTIYGLYDPLNVAHNGLPVVPVMVYLAIIFGLFVLGIVIFRRKRLPL